MPLVSLSETQLVQECGLCGTEHTHQLTDLQLGSVRGGPDQIAFPACTTCNSKEWLKRTWDECDTRFENTPFYQQRLAVNALAQRLKVMGKVEPALADEFAIEDGGNHKPPQRLKQNELKGAGVQVKRVKRTKGKKLWEDIQAGKQDKHPARRGGKP